MTALALRDEQTYWDDRQLAVLRSVGIGEDVAEGELTAFLHECQTRKLDPFTKQIYLIGRWDKRARRKVYRSQTGIDGFRLIARRAADKAGESIEYEDTLWCAEDGKWTDVWLSPQPPAACKVVVLRDGKRFPATARYAAYVQVNDDGNALGLWAKMPDGQLAKCCEALALRKAFPEELGGIYTDEEMAQADNPQRVAGEVLPDEPGTARPVPGVPDDWTVDGAIADGASAPSLEAATDMWRASSAAARGGKCSRTEAAKVQEVLRARMEELRNEATGVQTEAENARQAPAALDPEDMWAVKVEGITSASDADAVMSELLGEFKAGHINETHANQVRAAIGARAAQVADVIEGKVAA